MILDLAPAAQDYGAAGEATPRFSGLRGDVIVLTSTPETRQGLPLQPRQRLGSNNLSQTCFSLFAAVFAWQPSRAALEYLYEF